MFFAYYCGKVGTFTSFVTDTKSLRSHKTAEINGFLAIFA
jgi:hypothetical protein